MIINFYTNLSDPKSLDKNLESRGSITGQLRAESDILNPSILCEGDVSSYTNCNYLEIPDFGRSYFVDSFESVRNGLFRVNCHVDVLSTYKTQIRANTAILARSERVWDLYLDDGSFKVDNTPKLITKAFPSGFNNMSFILAVADGGAGSTASATTESTEGETE